MPTVEALVVLFSAEPYDGIKGSAKGMAEALARHTKVLFVDPTQSTRSRRPMDWITSIDFHPDLEQPASNLFRLPPIALPAHTRTGIRRVTHAALIRSTKRAIESIGIEPTGVLLQTPQLEVLELFPNSKKVLWLTDSYADGAALMGVKPTVIAAAESAAANHADIVVTVSDRLRRHWASRGYKVALIPNGVDPKPCLDTSVLMSRPRDLTLDRPIAGVVGTLSERLDLQLLEAVVASEINLLLVGPASFRTDRSTFDRLCEHNRVQWVGPKPYSDLDRYYAHIDVGLVPYTLSDFNRASAPLKPLDYLAAGLPVVSTPLQGVAAIGSPDIAVTRDKEGFVDATRRAIEISNDTDLARRRRRHVTGWTWDKRAREMLQVLDLGVR